MRAVGVAGARRIPIRRITFAQFGLSTSFSWRPYLFAIVCSTQYITIHLKTARRGKGNIYRLHPFSHSRITTQLPYQPYATHTQCAKCMQWLLLRVRPLLVRSKSGPRCRGRARARERGQGQDGIRRCPTYAYQAGEQISSGGAVTVKV